jgi:1-acyl-sn-glycerol-3-phosphate acyltransferase
MQIKSIKSETVVQPGYRHSDWETRRRFFRFLLKGIGFNFLAKIDRVEGVENVPAHGPALIMMNHIAFVDSLIVLHVMPRNIVPLAKAEVYDYPLIGFIPKMWGVIPVHREEIDRRAVQQTFEVLEAGEMVLVAPEGTRGKALGRGKEGIAYLAARSGVPVVPVAIEGTPGFPALRPFGAWKTAGAHVRIGKPFRYKAEYRKARRDDLARMTDEAMYILASMLPEQLRGVYHDLALATQETIEWCS